VDGAEEKRKLRRREDALHRHGSRHSSRNNRPAAGGAWSRCWLGKIHDRDQRARIAREIGVSRSTVWRWWGGSANWAFKAKAVRQRIFLEQVPDCSDAGMLKQRLKGGPLRQRIHHFFQTDSTKPRALTGSRGRAGRRRWCSRRNRPAARVAGARWVSERAAGLRNAACCGRSWRGCKRPLLTMMADSPLGRRRGGDGAERGFEMAE